jgi:hypothetical protein
VDARELLAVQLISELRSLLVPDLARERDGLGDDVIGGEQMVHKSQIFEDSEDLNDAQMMGVSLRHEGEEEACVEKDHAFGWP